MGPLAEAYFLDPSEQALVADALAVVRGHDAEQHAQLEGLLSRLGRAADLIRDSPSIASSWARRGHDFSGESLIDLLFRVPDYDLDLHIPTKAVFGQAFLIAKINFFKALGYSIEPLGAVAGELRRRIDHELGQSIFSKLGEELFVSIVTDPNAEGSVKASAARSLFRIWEERLDIEVDDFAPVLESALEARARVLPVLGTMLGTHEVFRLFQEARDSRFLDYFGEDDVQEDELLAFEEFLFGLAHEEIARLRAHLEVRRASCVSLDEARAVLGREAGPWTAGQDGAQALYTSYKERRVKATYRALTGARGPRKTAEEYFMVAFLRSGGRASLLP